MEEKEINQRNSYPIQTPEFSQHPEPPAHTTEEPIRLPKTIRALKNSREEKHHPRTIIICLDGTGDRFDSDNSNIVNFVSCLKKHSLDEQVTYYQSGIGTYDKGGLKNGIGAALDMAVGSGLGIHVKDAYKYLMQNYRDGDKICLLGFSRGAYTIRCLAGMLHKVGLLPASNGSQINFAYDFFKDDSEEGWKMSGEFKKTFCTDVNVYFVGLWDCVASVGFIPRKLPFSKSPTNSIQYFRHAMALDEHRSKFKVCQWQHENPDVNPELKRRGTVDKTPMGKVKRTGILGFGSKPQPKTAQSIDTSAETQTIDFSDSRSDKQESLEEKFNEQDKATRRHQQFKTDALEVWFMGAHADVGGGACKNEDRHMLSRIPLRWMLRQCFECDTGILFDTSRLAEQGLDVDTLWPEFKSPSKPSVGPPPALVEKYEKKTLAPLQRRSTFLPIGEENDVIKDAPTAEDLQYILPAESTEDHFDSLQRVNDQLVDAKGWWILEIWPVKIRVRSSDGERWEKRVRMNLGRHRAIREMEPHMHWTVRHRMDSNKYTLKVRENKGTTWREVV
ncbi:hypothetical protein K402DRAFT_452716 [Aulographum hederae CBS 113979]|uniref:T6SS Phospholipase effector Tle1-like catalytic domain-containing protein n=1 Tax=Aulographum hederae CBS 113979 TaxID=1176131 RepID=A0A6G1H5Y6_9PEZI|nr:hypothetical protein K402DRAFT_452716 [Aulographum hederae CBS 113979]